MFKNYFKIAIRNLGRNQGYAVINIFGLVIGMACCLLILLYVQDELSYDRYHQNAARIYRVALQLHAGNAPVKSFAVTSPPMAPALLRDYPEIRQAVRLQNSAPLVGYGERRFYEDNFFWADASVFAVFTFPLIQGDAVTALREPRSIVLAEKMARKYFGAENPIGKVLTVADTLDLKVTGVMANIPSHSHFIPDCFASFSTLSQIFPSNRDNWESNWWNHGYYTYLLLDEQASAAVVEQRISRLTARYIEEQEKISGKQVLFLQPLTAIHLRSNLRSEIAPNSDIRYVYIFSAVALLVLLIACTNFMNLATARSARRAKEVGVRKVLGAHCSQLVKQFIGESVLMSLLAFLIALVLVELLLPFFNELAGKTLALPLSGNAWLWLGLLGATLLTGIIAGGYPAFFLSAFRPVETLKGAFKIGVKGVLPRQGLVVFQYSISILLMIGTVTVYHQLEFMRNQRLGFDKEHVMVIPIRGDEAIIRRFAALRQELLENGEVLGVTASSAAPGGRLYNIAIRPEGTPANQTKTMLTLAIDHEFVKLYSLQLAAGRDLSKEFSADSTQAFLLNEAAVKDLGWGSPENAIGKQFNWGLGKVGRIVGVVKDFHFNSLQQRVPPMVMHLYPNWFEFLSVKIDGKNVPQALAFVESKWRGLVPGVSFEYSFLDASFDRQYAAEEKLGRISFYFSLLAILIACLGLFGLAAFFAEQRTKEIGVRKVLGASVAGIVGLLSKDFIKLMLVANLLAWPVAWYAMNKWLQDFAYRINIGWWIFALAGGVALFIALLTVSTQAIKAALANPVEVLRYE